MLREAGGGFASVALTALPGGDGLLSGQAIAAEGGTSPGLMKSWS